MRDYSKWTDHHGRVWLAPTIRGRLKFKIKSHMALRAFVFHRDNYTCQKCSVKATDVPERYDGRETLSCENWCIVVDHIVSRRNGGSHHPNNLQTLCRTCNSAKTGLIDTKR